MKYVTGIYALNIEDSTECCGDWHTSGIRWENMKLYESDDSIFKDYDIELNKSVLTYDDLFNVANTLRAILDLMERNERLGWLKGFRNDFICTDIYNQEFFENVKKLKGVDHWSEIDLLMKREFMWVWDKFRGV